MRDGEYVGTVPAADDADRNHHLDDGRAHADRRAPGHSRPRRAPRSCSRCRNLSRGTEIRDVSFSVRKGEILGFAGLMGAGRTEVARAIFGADPRRRRRDLRARPARSTSASRRTRCAPASAISREDRKQFGLATGLDVRNNIALASAAALHRPGRACSRRPRCRTRPTATSTSSPSRRRPTRRRCGCSRAATSRRSSSPNGCCATATS